MVKNGKQQSLKIHQDSNGVENYSRVSSLIDLSPYYYLLSICNEFLSLL